MNSNLFINWVGNCNPKPTSPSLARVQVVSLYKLGYGLVCGFNYKVGFGKINRWGSEYELKFTPSQFINWFGNVDTTQNYWIDFRLASQVRLRIATPYMGNLGLWFGDQRTAIWLAPWKITGKEYPQWENPKPFIHRVQQSRESGYFFILWTDYPWQILPTNSLGFHPEYKLTTWAFGIFRPQVIPVCW